MSIFYWEKNIFFGICDMFWSDRPEKRNIPENAKTPEREQVHCSLFGAKAWEKRFFFPGRSVPGKQMTLPSSSGTWCCFSVPASCRCASFPPLSGGVVTWLSAGTGLLWKLLLSDIPVRRKYAILRREKFFFSRGEDIFWIKNSISNLKTAGKLLV